MMMLRQLQQYARNPAATAYHRCGVSLLLSHRSPDDAVIQSTSTTTSRACRKQQRYFHSTSNLRAGSNKRYPAIVPQFQQLPLIHKIIKKNLHHMKIETMTKVQHDSYRALTLGKDVNILSPPDTGKTLAFLLPFLNEKLKVQHIKKGIHCIFVTPDSHNASANYLFTSELLQLMGPNITTQSLYESYSYERQVQRLSKKVPTILIATPGRLRQHIETSVLSKKISRKSPKKRRTDFSTKFSALTNTLVLDEADVLFRDHRDDIEFLRPYLAMGKNELRHTVLLSSYNFPDDADVQRWVRHGDQYYEKIDCRPKPMAANPPPGNMDVAFADAADVEEKVKFLRKRWRKQLKRLKVAWKEKVAVPAVPANEK